MTLKKYVDGVEVDMSAEDEAALRAEWAENDAQREATAYSRHRAGGKTTSHKDKDGRRVIDSRESGYPSIPDQLDQIYHEGIDAWKATIKVVKDRFPKP